jgi:hypothetical protein
MTYRRNLHFIVLATLHPLTSLAACGDDDAADDDVADIDAGAGTPDAMISASCLEAQDHSDFTWINENILAKSCAAFNQCHGATGTQAQLLLTTDEAYADLVGVASVQVPGKKLVDATNVDCGASYLYDKITDSDAIAEGKKSMPLNNPLMCQQKIDAVCRWIAAGAPND